MHGYKFITNWKFNTDIEKVWDEITNPEDWSIWWKYVEQTTLIKPGNSDGTGSIWKYKWSSRLPYSLSFNVETIKVDKPYFIEGVANGDLQGVGKWYLESDGNNTRVKYEWMVETNKFWMKLLAPIARPIFEWNHDAVMKQGEIGLKNYLLRKYA